MTVSLTRVWNVSFLLTPDNLVREINCLDMHPSPPTAIQGLYVAALAVRELALWTS